MEPKDRRGRPDTVKIVEVIQCTYAKGDGTVNDPVRACAGYWTKDGRFLWENDPAIFERKSPQLLRSEDPE